MSEVRLDDELTTSSNNWREAHIEVIDSLLGDGSPILERLYQHCALYTDEDLSCEFEGMTDKKITININFTVDVPIKVDQYTSED